eukprot:m.335128 g.335128  ORF g.335128 m.335128 type:complete len:350 (+) comp17520_c1_seq1:150-1199(+)
MAASSRFVSQLLRPRIVCNASVRTLHTPHKTTLALLKAHRSTNNLTALTTLSIHTKPILFDTRYHNPENISLSVKPVVKIKRLFESGTKKNYIEAWNRFETYMKPDSNFASENPDAVLKLCSIMLDHSFTSETQNKVVETMEASWVPQTETTYTQRAKMYAIEDNIEAVDRLKQEITKTDMIVPPTIRKLLKESDPDQLAIDRKVLLQRAIAYELDEDVWKLFEVLDKNGKATQSHYTAMLWSFREKADEQEEYIKDRLLPASNGRGWESNPEVFAARLHSLMLTDRYDEMYMLVQGMTEHEIKISNKVVQVLTRAGQRLQRQRRMNAEDRRPWEVAQLNFVPRKRLGV